ncbi:MAG: cold shock domain-containing protein [Myxococcota bacterium]
MRRNDILRLGVFYDGEYLAEASGFYRHHHDRKSHISPVGLHRSFERWAADTLSAFNVRITESTLILARAYEERPTYEELFTQSILERLQLQAQIRHLIFETGTSQTDFELSFEAHAGILAGRFDAMVLVAKSETYVPLARRAAACGMPVFLVHFDYEYEQEEDGELVSEAASPALIRAATFTMNFHSELEEAQQGNGPSRVLGDHIDHLFATGEAAEVRPPDHPSAGQLVEGYIKALPAGRRYGFIALREWDYPVFFHERMLDPSTSFEDLRVGDEVVFVLVQNPNDNRLAAGSLRLGAPRARP